MTQQMWNSRHLAKEQLFLPNDLVLLLFPWIDEVQNSTAVDPIIAYISSDLYGRNAFCFRSTSELLWRIAVGSLETKVDPYVQLLSLNQAGMIIATTRSGLRFQVDPASGYLNFLDQVASG